VILQFVVYWCIYRFVYSNLLTRYKWVRFPFSFDMWSVLIRKRKHTVMLALGTPLSSLIKYLENIRVLSIVSRAPFNRSLELPRLVSLPVWRKKCRAPMRDNRLKKTNRRKYREITVFYRWVATRSDITVKRKK